MNGRLSSIPDTILVSSSPEQTFRIGRDLAKSLKPGSVVCLYGELGAGKTHLAKGIAAGFEINPAEVQSPTFTLINEYQGELPLYHFDFYRINSEKEALAMGVEEYFYGEGICLIEWPSKIASLLPGHAINVYMNHLGEEKREIKITTE